MAQYVRRYALLDPNRFGSITHDPVELACGDGQEGIAAGKQPQPWLRHPPVVLEDRQQLWREHRMPVLLALPLFDAHQHALAVDVRHLEVGNFGDTQTGAVGHAEGGLVFDTGCRLQGLEVRFWTPSSSSQGTSDSVTLGSPRSQRC